MGLDVGLIRYENYADAMRRQEEAQEEVDFIWDSYPSYESMSESQKDEAQQRAEAIYEEFGLGTWGMVSESEARRIEIPSKTNPEHIFRIGYWRSSYNPSGINSVLRRNIGTDLYEICGVEDHNSYHLQLDWNRVIERCVAAIEELSANSDYDVVTVNSYFYTEKVSDQEALAVFKQQVLVNSQFDSYSNSKGYFFKKPLQVVAVFTGTRHNETHLVVQNSDNYEFYIQALRIMIETAEYVLAQPDQDKYYVTWSA